MINYKNMTNEEIKEQLEWSDSHEFSYSYSMWAFEEIERLNNIINELEEENENRISESLAYDLVKARVQELEHIIKEVREYIEMHTDKLKTTRIPKIDFNYKELLEILDKGENNVEI